MDEEQLRILKAAQRDGYVTNWTCDRKALRLLLWAGLLRKALGSNPLVQRYEITRVGKIALEKASTG
jgi:hypothetical protein